MRACPRSLQKPIVAHRSRPHSLCHTLAANAVRFNTTVSASDARLANMSYAQKISEQRLQRSQERSKWYQLSEEERSEILFPPLLGIEIIQSSCIENVLHLEVRPSVNLLSLTIEKVVAKMQSSHLQLLDLLRDDLRYASVSAVPATPATPALPSGGGGTPPRTRVCVARRRRSARCWASRA